MARTKPTAREATATRDKDLHPQVVHLGDDLPEKPGRVRQGAAGLQEKQGQVPQIIGEAQGRMPGAVKKLSGLQVRSSEINA